jgi:type VI secretion system protein
LGRLRLHLGSPNVTPLAGQLLLLLCLFQAACATHPLKVAMTISTDANNNSPVLLSVVIPKNQTLFKKLLDMTAKQWFAQREQLLRDYRRELEETYYEFIPGQQVPEINRKVPNKVPQGILFVNYQTPGSHRYTFDINQPLKIGFAQQSVNLSQ